ncbi:hypothetical protein DdX_14705 [Ditylenchus destructor]|uniref:Uncharacterized protein n=1 Tax=Ditylenchus destructor TaxID=166010 RepID=A0AAD4MQQ4_9BILA|nr:hypothetical protein DdX_14705 [Ditylenchus destructor]
MTSAVPIQLPAYLPYLNLVTDIGVVLAHTFSLVPMSHLIYSAMFNRKILVGESLHPSIIVFLLLHICFTSIILPYHLYIIIKWIPQSNYNPNVLFWTGIWACLYFLLSSASVFILTLERCLAIIFPLQYKPVIRKFYTPLSVLFLAVLLIVFITLSLLELPLDVIKVRNCQTFTCIVSKRMNELIAIVKFTFGALNIIQMIYFLNKAQNLHQQSDRLIKITLILEIAFNTVPIIFYYFITMVTGVSPANYTGHVVALLFALNVAICSVFYSKTFVRKSGKYLFSRSVASAANTLAQ